MHAVARDTESFPKPCVYIQLDEGSVGMGPGGDDEGEEEEEEEEEESAELRLVPAADSEGALGCRMGCTQYSHLAFAGPMACLGCSAYVDMLAMPAANV
jgi:hypothetical protein